MNTTNPKRKGMGRWIILATFVLVGAGAVVGANYLSSPGERQATNIPIFTVTEGPLTISVSEAGIIKSRQQEVIKSELEGMATILYLIPEGTRVKKGDLLVELDATKLDDQQLSQEIVVRNAEAAYIGALETLAVVESQAKSDIAAAELAYRFAKEDLLKYRDGDYPKELEEAESRIIEAKAALEQATDTLAWSERLHEENFLSHTELQKDRLNKTKAELQLNLAEMSKRLLVKYTYERRLAELESDVEQTHMALERVQRKAKADIVQAEAQLEAKELERDRQKSLLEKTLRMIDKAKIYAPTDGLVVYATTGGGGGFRSNNEPLAEGQQIRERQELIYLPTASSVMADIKVHESTLSKVRPGLPVRVTVDAVPGKTYWGRVARIAPLPDSQSFWQNPDMRVFTTEIPIDGDGSELRTGMSCRAEVIVERHASAIFVPIQSVIRIGGQPTVYVVSPTGPQPRVIELGMDNNRMAHVIKGLEPGEQVLLNPPLSDATARDEKGLEMPQMPEIPAPMAIPAGEPGPGAGAAERGPGRGGREPRGEGGAEGRTRGEGRRAPDGVDWSTLTPEQRQEMIQQRMQNMTPEERERMREAAQRRQRDGGGGPGAPGSGGAPARPDR